MLNMGIRNESGAAIVTDLLYLGIGFVCDNGEAAKNKIIFLTFGVKTGRMHSFKTARFKIHFAGFSGSINPFKKTV